MHTPTFSLSHKIINSIVKLELAIHDIKNLQISPKTRSQIASETGSENMECLGKLVGMSVSADDAKAYHEGEKMPSPGSNRFLFTNYRSTRDFIYSSGNDPYMPLSSAMFLHINKLLGSNVYESWEVGRFRTATDKPNEECDPWVEKRSDRSEHYDYSKYLTDVLNWFTNRRYQIHPVLKTGTVIYELFALYPFVSGNLASVVTLTELLLNKTHLSLRGLFPVAKTFYNHESEFLDRLDSVSDENRDITFWLELFAKALAADTASLNAEIVRIADQKKTKRRVKLLELNPRQRKLLNHLRFNLKISRKEYVAMTGVSAMTAYRDINEMVEKKLIVCKGGGRSTYYTLPEQNVEKIKDVSSTRKVVKVISDQSGYTSGEKPVEREFSDLNISR